MKAFFLADLLLIDKLASPCCVLERDNRTFANKLQNLPTKLNFPNLEAPTGGGPGRSAAPPFSPLLNVPTNLMNIPMMKQKYNFVHLI